jgi:hypothetical protein
VPLHLAAESHGSTMHNAGGESKYEFWKKTSHCILHWEAKSLNWKMRQRIKVGEESQVKSFGRLATSSKETFPSKASKRSKKTLPAYIFLNSPPTPYCIIQQDVKFSNQIHPQMCNQYAIC